MIPQRGPFLLVAVSLSLAVAPASAAPSAEPNAELEKIAEDLGKLERAIELSKELILRSPDAPELPELHLRLAELYVEKSRLLFEQEMRQAEEGARTLSGERSMEVTVAKKLAIETFDKIISDFPNWAHTDQARFFKAHEMRELGLWNLMLETLEALIEKHPKSRWAVEGNLILGDYYFDRSSPLEAEPYYQRILEQPETHLHDMARYKLGWVRINQERFKDALNLFEAAVTSRPKKRAGAVGAAKILDVKREALMALTWPYSEVREPKLAPAYFRNLAPSSTTYVDALRRLANRYYIKTRYADAVSLYREVVSRSSDLDRNIDYLQRLYEGVRKLAESDPVAAYSDVHRDLRAFAETTARFRNDWARSEEDKQGLSKDLEVRARDLVTRAHAAAQQEKSKALYTAAARAYDFYLEVFDAGDKRDSMRENRASALAEAKSQVEAGRRYEELASGLEEGDARKDAVVRGVAAYYAAIDADAKARLENPGKRGPLLPLDRIWARRGLLDLGRWFVKRFPDDTRAPEVKFNIARMHYQEGDYEQASQLFAAFVKAHPGHRDVASAGNLALDALHKLDQFEALAELADSFAANPQITDAAFKSEAARLASAARKREVEFTVLETPAEDFDARMLAEWEAKKDTAMGEEILFTAFQRYVNEKALGGVMAFGTRYLGAYAKSKRALAVQKTLNAFALGSGDYDGAVKLLGESLERFASAAEAGSWRRTLADLQRALGDTAAAQQSYAAIVEGGGKDAGDARSELMSLQYAARQWDALAKSAEAAAASDARALAPRFYLAAASLAAGNTKAAQKHLRRAARLSPANSYDEAVAGDVALLLAERQHRAFDAIEFKGARGAERVVQQKVSAMESSEGAYVAAIQAGRGAAAIAALHAMARLSSDFGKFLAGAPVPRGTRGAAAEEYRAALAAQAAPYQQKAEETLAICAAKAEELRVFSDAARACQQRTLEVKPAGAPPARRRAELSRMGEAVAMSRRTLLADAESTEALETLAAAVLGLGDGWLAGVLLTRAMQIDPASATLQNLSGVAAWLRGDLQTAHDFFEPAAEAGDATAAANLLGLYTQMGYAAQAERMSEKVGDPAALRRGPALHPTATQALGALGGS